MRARWLFHISLRLLVFLSGLCQSGFQSTITRTAVQACLDCSPGMRWDKRRISCRLWLFAPVHGLLVLVKLQFLAHPHLLEHVQDEFLLAWGERDVPFPALVVLASPEVALQQGGEPFVLVGVHALLEVGESSCKAQRLAFPVEVTLSVLAALPGVDEFQMSPSLQHPAVGDLPQASLGSGAVSVQACRVVVGYLVA